MRLDRSITLNLVQPLHRACGLRQARNRVLPVLMFHSVSDDPESGVGSYYRICTSLKRFREQMKWLKENEYYGVTLSRGLACLDAKAKNQKLEIGKGGDRELFSDSGLRPVAITFDDGFRDFYAEAVPILNEFSFSATMYIPTAFMSSSSPAACRFNGRECLRWAEVKELHCGGIEMGSHTVHHPKLVDLSWAQIKAEVGDSKSQIEDQLGVKVGTFAYPYAFPQCQSDFVGKFKEILLGAGYETCVTTQVGRYRSGEDPLQIKRLPINSDDDVQLLQAKLEGGYDWLAVPQNMLKQIKQRIFSQRKAARISSVH